MQYPSKKCSLCGEIKDLSAFGKASRLRDGHRTECRECANRTAIRYRQERPESFKVASRKWREANREVIAKVSARNRPVKHHHARAKKFNAVGRFTVHEFARMVAESCGRCFYCGDTARLETDHKTPLCRGGSNYIGNLCLACSRCNRSKGRMTAEEFLRKLTQGVSNELVPALNESG